MKFQDLDFSIFTYVEVIIRDLEGCTQVRVEVKGFKGGVFILGGINQHHLVATTEQDKFMTLMFCCYHKCHFFVRLKILLNRYL